MDATLIVESWREGSERVVPLAGEMSIGGPADDIAIGEAGPLAIVSWRKTARDAAWCVRPCSPHVWLGQQSGAVQPLVAETELRHGDELAFGNPDERPPRVRVLLGDRARVLDEERHLRTVIDPLTRVLNRRALMTRLARLRSPASVLMIDLDWLKKVNDTHGMLVGDAALVVTARRIREHVRWPACVARIGGEEFAVVMPGEHAAARQTAEAIRAACEQMFTVDGRKIVVTASIGVAPLATDPLAALREADEALVAAKVGGRNAVFGRT